MGNDLTHVKGLAEITRNLMQFPDKVVPVIRGGFRAGMSEVALPAARANVHSVSGLLAAGLKVGTSSRGGRIVAYVRARGPHAHMAKWIEYGVKPHRIPKLTLGQHVALAFGGRVVSSVNHPGFKGKGFMRKALDNNPGRIMERVAAYMIRRLGKLGGNVSNLGVQIGEQ